MKAIACGLVALVFAYPSVLQAAEASLYVSPERGFYGVGDLFEVQVLTDTGGEAVNAAEAELTFDPNEIRIEHVSTEDSILSLWPTPPAVSNETGTVRFSGWATGRYEGQDGLLVTLVVRPLRLTLSTIRLESGAVLAADDRGSNIVTSMRSGVYTIEPRTEIAEAPDRELADLSVQLASAAQSLIDPKPPEAPQLVEYPYGILDEGERVVVRGVAPPNSTVLMWRARGDEPKELVRLTTAADGSFVYVSDEGLDTGVYRVWAQTADEGGMQSEASRRIRFEVRPQGTLAAVASVASVATALLPLFVLLLIAGLGIAFIMHRQRVEQMTRGRYQR